VLQRDMQVDGGTRSITEDEALAIRRASAQAIQAVYDELGFPPISDAEVEAAVVAHASEDMPARDVLADLAAADQFLSGDQTIVAVIAALHRRGFAEVAANILEMGRERVVGDYLQPAAIFDRQFRVQSAINDPNDYRGPGTGYRLEGERWREVQQIHQARSPRDFIADRIGASRDMIGKLMKDRIADSMFQQLLLRPDEYSVIATPNLNGDYISDACAAQVGGLGIAPGANIGDGYAIFEATHGTAPKYADKDVINPGSVMLSGVMMFRFMGWNEAADLIEGGMERTILQKKVTYDFERLMEGATKVKTSQFADAIVENMGAAVLSAV